MKKTRTWRKHEENKNMEGKLDHKYALSERCSVTDATKSAADCPRTKNT